MQNVPNTELFLAIKNAAACAEGDATRRFQMTANTLDTLIDAFDAYLDAPLNRFWQEITAPPPGKASPLKYYGYTAMALVLYLFAFGLIFIALRCLFVPATCPLSGRLAALFPFSAAAIPPLLAGIHRLKSACKPRPAKQPETFPQALRNALQQTTGLTLDEDTLELAMWKALLSMASPDDNNE